MMAQCPDYELVRLGNQSRNANYPAAYTTKVLVELSLKACCNQTEVAYQESVLSKRDFTVDELLEFYKRAKVTFMAQLMQLGRMTHFDKVMKMYEQEAYDCASFQVVIKKLFARSVNMYQLQSALKQIFTNYKKH